jgi:hypothetical protein
MMSPVREPTSGTTAARRAGPSAPGWPRRPSPCAADVLGQGTRRPGAPSARPTAWAAEVVDGAWDPWQFDLARAERMRAEDLCRLCGRPRGDQVYLLAPQRRSDTMVVMYGGALCSLACARLTAAVCPHYTAESPVEIYLVPRHERVDLIGGGLDNDDEYDIVGLHPADVLRVARQGGGARR